MWRLLNSTYTIFFAPRQKDEDIRNREVVLNVLLAGTLVTNPNNHVVNMADTAFRLTDNSGAFVPPKTLNVYG